MGDRDHKIQPRIMYNAMFTPLKSQDQMEDYKSHKQKYFKLYSFFVASCYDEKCANIHIDSSGEKNNIATWVHSKIVLCT